MFDLKRPCSTCPFLKDTPTELIPGRLESIKRGLLQDKSFHCHKTVDYSNSSEGDITNKSQMCAGAMIYLEKKNSPNQMMRIAERLGRYNYKELSGFDEVID